MYITISIKWRKRRPNLRSRPDWRRHSGQIKLPLLATWQQTRTVSPQAVQEVAAQAEKKDPSVVDTISGFYAQHPDVVKALGGMALAIAMAKIAQRQ